MHEYVAIIHDTIFAFLGKDHQTLLYLLFNVVDAVSARITTSHAHNGSVNTQHSKICPANPNACHYRLQTLLRTCKCRSSFLFSSWCCVSSSVCYKCKLRKSLRWVGEITRPLMCGIVANGLSVCFRPSLSPHFWCCYQERSGKDASRLSTSIISFPTTSGQSTVSFYSWPIDSFILLVANWQFHSTSGQSTVSFY